MSSRPESPRTDNYPVAPQAGAGVNAQPSFPPVPTSSPQRLAISGSVRLFSVGARGVRTVRWGYISGEALKSAVVRTKVPGFTWKTFLAVLATGIFSGALFGALIASSSEVARSAALVWSFVGALSLGIGYAFAELLGKTVEVLGVRKLIFFALPIGKVPISVMGTFLISLLILQGLPYVFVLSGALYFTLYGLGVTILSYRAYFETQRNPLF